MATFKKATQVAVSSGTRYGVSNMRRALWVAALLALGALSRVVSGTPIDYTYDALGRLICVVYDGNSATIYKYDRAGNRTVSAAFDPLAYIASYGDLIQAFGYNAISGARHYVNNGYDEGRKVIFNAFNYIASYGDLIAAFGDNASLGVQHYIANGYGEGRSTSFDPVAYLISNPDLGAAGLTADNVVHHFITNGYGENRSASGAFGTEQTHHALTIGVGASDVIGMSGDKDWFSVSLNGGETYIFTLSGVDTSQGNLADPYLAVYDANGLIRGDNNDNGTNRDSLILFTVPATGTYYLAASGVSTGTYTIRAVLQ